MLHPSAQGIRVGWTATGRVSSFARHGRPASSHPNLISVYATGIKGQPPLPRHGFVEGATLVESFTISGNLVGTPFYMSPER